MSSIFEAKGPFKKFYFNAQLRPDLFDFCSLWEKDEAIPDACYFQSSGTSGKTKFYGHSPDTLLLAAKSSSEFLALTASDRILNVLPLFHVGGYMLVLRAQLSSSKLVNFPDFKWNPTKFVSLLEQEKITGASLVPTQVYDLLQQKLCAPPFLRWVLVGGARLEEDLYFQARDLGWPLLPCYGMTETAAMAACASLSSLEEKEFPKLELLSHYRDSFEEEGLLYLKGPALFLHCLELDLQSKKYKVSSRELDAPYNSRDCVKFFHNLDQKLIHITGRKEKGVKILGEWVQSEDILSFLRPLFLREFPQISLNSWTVEFEKHERKGHEACVLIEQGILSKESFEAWLLSVNKELAGPMRIGRIEWVDKIRRNALGKRIL